jgi:hypothetical protein
MARAAASLPEFADDKKPLRSRSSVRLSVTTSGATAEGLSATRVFSPQVQREFIAAGATARTF